MRRAVPGATALAVALLIVAVAGRPEPPDPATALAAGSMAAQPDPTDDAQTYRIGYVSADRPMLAAATPGGPAVPVLDGDAAGSAAADADARAGTLVWVTQQPAGGSDLVVRRPGAAPTRLTTGATDRHPVLSPDGARVAFTSDRGGSDDIWLVEVTGGPPRRLTDHPGSDIRPTWSPDGRTLAFASTRDDPAGDIYRITVPAGDAVGQPDRLTATPGFDGEPAWSPDGSRLAFTTARFVATGSTTVVTMPAGGGQASRAVPPPWDAAEPAWAPDSRRLAFASRQPDPSGDVLTVDGATVTPVAADPARAERDPAWRGSEVLHTTIAVDETTDVWSADERGGDRRDLTARPGLAETGPAYSADGTRLAYSAGRADGGNRIEVADADGRNPVTLAPTGTLPGDHDTDPTWSPDGTAVAFTRQPADDPGIDSAPASPPSRILLVRVADGALLGELPMPAHLVGRDAEPAWSPDGTRIAVSRSSEPRRSLVDPPRVDQPLLPGDSVDVAKTVTVPEIPASPDVVFFLDTTASMAQIIETLKGTITTIAGQVRTRQPDARFALVAYGAPAGPGNTGLHYRRLVDLTRNDGELTEALTDLPATGGGEEGWYNAIFQALAGGESERINLRPGGSPIFVLIGDAPSTGNTRFPGTGTVEKAEVIARMTAPEHRAKLVAVPVQGVDEAGLNFDTDGDGRGEATEIADATGGTVTGDAVPATITQAVIDGISATRVTVVPQVTGCDDGLGLTFDPPQVTVESGTAARFTERLTIASGAVPGSVLGCEVLFDVGSPVPADQVRQTVTVRVAHPPRPFVRVDDVTVEATGPDGARVDYPASATAPDGSALPAPDCDPPPGSLFPIGQTLVTCTAEGTDDEPGRDVALITVLDSSGGPGERIWVARIATATADGITFADQHDLSARVPAEPCWPRRADRAPAWSPDSAELAFSDDGGRIAGTGICVVDADDGGDPRAPVAPADRTGRNLADPAWTPDGSRIAFASYASAEPSQVRTVPSAGGSASTVIHTAGGAAQPAFQLVPARDLTLTVAVTGQPGFLGGADVTVTWTARNTSTRPVRNVFLSLTLPAALLPPAGVDSRCEPAGTLCRLGDLGVGDQQVVSVRLPARAAVDAVVSGRLTGTGAGDRPVTRLAQAPVRVLAPALTVDPAIGPPGFVTRARGSNFPPGATVRLRWEPGITARPETVVVNPDGSFVGQVLIMRKDVLGPRLLTAERVAGIPFGPVRADRVFLVVPRPQAPPNFNGRG